MAGKWVRKWDGQSLVDVWDPDYEEPTPSTGTPGELIEFDPSLLSHLTAVEPTQKDPANMTPTKAPSEGDTVTGIRYNPETNSLEKSTIPYNDPRLSGAGEAEGPGVKSASVTDSGIVSDPMFDKNWKDPNAKPLEVPQAPSFAMPSFVMPTFTMPEWPTFTIPELPAYPTAPTQAAAQASVTPKSSGTDRSKIRRLTLLSDQNKSVSSAKLGNTSTGTSAGKKRLLG